MIFICLVVKCRSIVRYFNWQIKRLWFKVRVLLLWYAVRFRLYLTGFHPLRWSHLVSIDLMHRRTVWLKETSQFAIGWQTVYKTLGSHDSEDYCMIKAVAVYVSSCSMLWLFFLWSLKPYRCVILLFVLSRHWLCDGLWVVVSEQILPLAEKRRMHWGRKSH